MPEKLEPGKVISRLAEVVRKEPEVRIKFGRTNGRDCLHIIKETDSARFPRGSYTLYDDADWDSHPWNGLMKKERRANREVQEAVANKAAI